jgi:hypothetical protein
MKLISGNVLILILLLILIRAKLITIMITNLD